MNSFVDVNVVDAFTNQVFSGNPAAVCCLSEDIPDSLKMKIAAEMNLSETAFATLDTEPGSFQSSKTFGLRWFTPTNEVDLCGHATLATAAVIFDKLGNDAQMIEFKTRSGVLKAIRNETFITLDFPLNSPCAFSASNLKDIIQIVCGNMEIQDVQHSSKTKKLLLRLDDKYSRQDLENLTINAQALLQVENGDTVKGVILTLRASDDEGYDFYSRYFAPWVGIAEDPVCGSAHTVLAPYWQQVLAKNEFKARQCSKRGGDIFVNIVGQQVQLKGQVAHVLEGKIRIQH